MRSDKFIVVEGTKPVLTLKSDKLQAGRDEIVPEITEVSSNEFTIKIKGKEHFGEIVSLKQNVCTVNVNGNTYKFSIETEKSLKRQKKLAKKGVSSNVKITAPLPGTILETMVKEGDKVAKGEALMILEAMKMQNEIVSPISGKVSRLMVSQSDTVLKDQLLIDISPK